MLRTSRALNIIREYGGQTDIKDVKVYADPQVSTCYAIRCKIDGEVKQFLLTGWDSSIPDAKAATHCLEEAEFESWPPPEGEPRFSW
jgi:hypothetical protein